MTDSYYDQALIALNTPPSLEEAVVDWLLARGDGAGFTSFPVFGHSASHEGLSPAEQVAGRRRRQQFQIQIRAERVNAFLQDFRTSFGKVDIHFWVFPLVAGGRFETDE